MILGLHGFGDYRKAWEEPAEIWAKDGITTYAYDQRGFGKSPTRGRWPGAASPGRRRHRRGRPAARPLSRRAALPRRRKHGQRVALVAADRGAEVDGLILASAGAALARHASDRSLNAGAWFFAHTVPWIPNGPTSIDFQPTDNPKTLEKLPQGSADAARRRGSTWAMGCST